MSASPKKQMLGGDGVMRVVTPEDPVLETDGYLFDYLVVNLPFTAITSILDENGDSLVDPNTGGQWDFGFVSTKRLEPGVFIIGKNGARIKQVNVSAGSVIGYQSRDKGNLRL